MGLRLRQVRRLTQLVALALVAAVLSGAQCVEVCSLLAHRAQAPIEHSDESDMPCHQKQSSSDLPAPSDTEQCSHHEMVAEKRSSDSNLDVASLVVVALVSDPLTLALVGSSDVVVPDNASVPRLSPQQLNTVLRV